MDRFEVALKTFPGDQVPFVAALRTVGKISLAVAVAVHRHATSAQRTTRVAGIDRSVAGHIAATFTDSGIDVVVRPSTATSPMIRRLTVNVAYRRDALRRVVAASNKGNDHASTHDDASR